MFPALYFPLVAAQSVRCAPGAFIDKVREGNLPSAGSYANRWAEDDPANADLPWLLQLHADMLTTLGVADEAEEQYRRAQKLMRAPRQVMRAVSCRNAGWQAMFRYRLTTALSCFARVLEESEIDPLIQFDARFGIVCALHELGHPRDAATALDELTSLIEALPPQETNDWREIVAALRLDMAVQRELRQAPALSDHAYWHSEALDGSTAGGGVGESISACEAAAARVSVPLLRYRLEYLRELRTLANGERDVTEAIMRHLQWAQQAGLHEYGRTTRLEVVMGALARSAANLAETTLEPLHRMEHATSTSHRQLEYIYCVSKVRQAQGRVSEAMQLYGRYALIAMQCLRADAHAIAPFMNRTVRRAPQLDDVGARLPAKYRRAYRYLQENLDRPDLSVRELAIEIGVTERALQTAFKNFLGLSPTELIRRQRMERIRAELEDPYTSERNILGAANKWGVQNRSTLVSSYRKQFNEAPSETLER